MTKKTKASEKNKIAVFLFSLSSIMAHTNGTKRTTETNNKYIYIFLNPRYNSHALNQLFYFIAIKAPSSLCHKRFNL